MTMTNSVQLLGHLGAQVEVRYTQAGMPVANFRLATNETWTSNGQKQTHTEWHRVVIFGKLAEVCGEHLAKGSQVMISGKLRTRNWEKDGVTRYTTEVHANQVQFLGRPKTRSGSEEVAESAASEVQEAVVVNSDLPF